MGFAFGNVTELNNFDTVLCFILVIIFIITFDFVVSLMEYFIREYPMYNRMVQMIYKELMLMGLVSFTIILVEAASPEHALIEYHSWILGVDFSHILLFFMTFFFVVHAFYLMFTAATVSVKYRTMFLDTFEHIIKDFEDLKKENSWRYFLSRLEYLPLSPVQDRIEFALVQCLFQNTYFLPDGFNFASYLSGCFDRYALHTINRSMFSWLVLSFMAILNYIRSFIESFNVSCAAAAHRRLVSHADDAADDHHVSGDDELRAKECGLFHLRFFLGCAMALVSYTIIVMIFARLYKKRLINRIGFSSADDYIDFLKFVDRETERRKFAVLTSTEAIVDADKVTTASLREDIEQLLNADEGGGEEVEFQEIGEYLSTLFENVRDVLAFLILNVRIFFLSLLRPSRTAGRMAGAISILSGGGGGGGGGDQPKDSTLESNDLEKGVVPPPPSSGSPLSSPGGGSGGTRKRSNSEDLKQSVEQQAEKTTAEQKKAMMNKLKGSAKKTAVAAARLSFVDPAALTINAASTGTSATTTTAAAAPPLTGSILNIEANNARKRTAIRLDRSSPQEGALSMLAMLQRLDDKNRRPGFASSSALGNGGPETQAPPISLHGAQASSYMNRRRRSELFHPMFPPQRNVEEGDTSGVVRPFDSSGAGGVLGAGVGVSVADLKSPSPAPSLAATSPAVSMRRASITGDGMQDSQVSIIEKYRLYKRRMSSVPAGRRRGAGDETGPAAATASSTAASARKRLNAFTILSKCWSNFRNVGKIEAKGSQKQQIAGSGRRNTLVKNISGSGFLDVMNSAPSSSSKSSTDGKDKKDGEQSGGEEEEENFSDIYLFKKPILFSRSVELCIMFNCLYMAFWITNFTFITSRIHLRSVNASFSQIFMVLPIIIVLPCIGYIAKTCSLLSAVSELDLNVIHEVLIATEDADVLLKELRGKILDRINLIAHTEDDKMNAIHALFEEIDQDGSGEIDKVEFRYMLRALKLTYSDQRFKRLYRSIDTNGDNKIGKVELDDFLFPTLRIERERRLVSEKRNESRKTFGPSTPARATISSPSPPTVLASSTGLERRISFGDKFHESEDEKSSNDSSSSDDELEKSNLSTRLSRVGTIDRTPSGERAAEGTRGGGGVALGLQRDRVTSEDSLGSGSGGVGGGGGGGATQPNPSSAKLGLGGGRGRTLSYHHDSSSDEGDVLASFDGISYDHAAAVIEMSQSPSTFTRPRKASSFDFEDALLQTDASSGLVAAPVVHRPGSFRGPGGSTVGNSIYTLEDRGAAEIV